MSQDKVAAIKRRKYRDQLIKAYENYKADPIKFETIFFKQVLEFAKIKLFYLEMEFPDIGTANTADDYAQEVAIAVWQGLPNFRGNTGESFYSWVHKICFNKAADFFNELLEQKQTKVSLTVTGRDEHGGSTDEDDNPEIYKSSGSSHISYIPSWVEGEDRYICQMILGRRSYKQIGKDMGISEDAVKQRMYKLRKRAEKRKV